jgi:hypothetical protein
MASLSWKIPSKFSANLPFPLFTTPSIYEILSLEAQDLTHRGRQPKEEPMETQEVMNVRISALEAKVAALEQVVAAGATKKKSNRRERTPEEKAEKVRQLRAGKAAAKARREAAALTGQETEAEMREKVKAHYDIKEEDIVKPGLEDTHQEAKPKNKKKEAKNG